MIVKMKKLSLLLYYKEKDFFLRGLQDEGVVHVTESQDIKNSEIVSADLKDSAEAVKSSESFLKKIKGIEHSKEIVDKPIKESLSEDACLAIESYEKLEQEVSLLEASIESREKDISMLSVWGEFDPAVILSLREAAVYFSFYQTSFKKFGMLELDDLTYKVINNDGKLVSFVVIDRDKKSEVVADEIQLPASSFTVLVKELKDLQKKRSDIQNEIRELVAYAPVVSEYLVNQRNVYNYSSADVNFLSEAEGSILSFSGFFPAKKESSIKKFMEQFNVYYSITDPIETDDVPVQLKNGRFARLFEPITKIYALPRYNEIDPTSFFAPFFALYFGLCLGDLGYGLLTMIFSLLAYVKMPKKMKGIAVLGIVLASFTMFSGILLNTFFGQNIFPLEGNPDYLVNFAYGEKIAFLGSYGNLKYFPAMGFAVVLGVIQILLGVSIRIVNGIRQKGFAWGFEPLGKFLMIAGIYLVIAHPGGFVEMTGIDISTYSIGPLPYLGTLEIGQWIKDVGYLSGVAVLLSGLFMMMFLNKPQINLLKNFGPGLWALYNFVVGIIGDTLSYLRLFALGLAGGLLGNAFNGIAFSFIDDGMSYMVIFTILLLIFAHALNFILAFIGSIVHPLRLTFVEFYGNIGFGGGGKEYAPLKKEKMIS